MGSGPLPNPYLVFRAFATASLSFRLRSSALVATSFSSSLVRLAALGGISSRCFAVVYPPSSRLASTALNLCIKMSRPRATCPSSSWSMTMAKVTSSLWLRTPIFCGGLLTRTT